MKITVIGAGRWGSFIAWYLDRIGHKVTLYGKENSPHMIEFFNTRKNNIVTLPESIELSVDINSVTGADVIILSVFSQSLRSLMSELAELKLTDKIFVLCMKGIEIESGKRLSEIVAEYTDPSNKIAVWLGPGHVQEFVAEHPNCMVIDSADKETKKLLVNEFSSDLIRFYFGEDLIGNEIGAAAKNVVGIAAGILDGLGISTLKGALMARGAREVSRLIVALGGKEQSAYGLCHLGDYEATVFSKHSHNRAFGEAFVLNKPFENGLAEGFYTSKAIHLLCEKHGVDMPICEAIYKVLYENADLEDTFNSLFKRPLKKEFYETV